MAGKKGVRPPNAGKGRKKGVPNKATTDVRSAIALLAERNVDKLEGWLRRVARKDPYRAADLFLRTIEYHVPKLARTEMTGKNGAELLPVTINVIPVAASKR